MNFDAVRKEFSLFEKRKDWIYFDSACTTLKPKSVVNAVVEYYSDYTGCAGRSIHKLSKMTEEHFEGSRVKIAKFFNAKPEEVVFTRNTTEGLNWVPKMLSFQGEKNVALTTNMEHHSVLLPLQALHNENKLKLEYLIANKDGEIEVEAFKDKISKNTKLVATHHTTNTTGVTSPIEEIIKISKENDAITLIDAAQGAPHKKIDFKKLGCDFLSFSGHKMLGPTGIGCLIGKSELLEKLPAINVGGETIETVSMYSAKFLNPPHKFEGGIQHYAGAIGLGAACDFLQKIGMNEVELHEKKLAKKLLSELLQIKEVEIYGTTDATRRGALAAFNVRKNGKIISPHTIAGLLDEYRHIELRSGIFCAQLAMEHFGAPQGAVRPSLYVYNGEAEIEEFAKTLKQVIAIV